MAENKNPNILDLDKLIPEKRLIKLAGKKIDVTKIPSKVTLTIADRYEEINKDDPKSMDVVMDMACDIINSQNEDKIDKEWLYDNTDIQQLIALVEFVMEPINKRVNKEDEGKNKGKAQEN